MIFKLVLFGGSLLFLLFSIDMMQEKDQGNRDIYEEQVKKHGLHINSELIGKYVMLDLILISNILVDLVRRLK